MKVYTKISKECSLEEDYENCKRIKKLKISDFCINIILGLIEVFQNKVESLINQSETKLLQEVRMIMPKTISKEKKRTKFFII